MQEAVIVRFFDKNSKKMITISDKKEIEEMLKNPYMVNMKYLGFKDRTGKDVFEGDIIKCWGNGGELLYGGAAITLGKFTYHNIPDFVEVVGNKFENPEMNKHDV